MKSESYLNQELITFNIQDELERSENERDQIEIKLSSHTFKINYYQLCKYSQLIQNKYQKSDTENHLNHDIKRIQSDYNIEENNIITFFNILKEGNMQFLSYQFRDLFILAEFFKVKFLQSFLERYSKAHFNDINCIINIILSSQYNTTNEYLPKDELSNRMEQLLSDKIDLCIQNENFGKLPISIINRIIEKSDREKITSDNLYIFIAKSIENRYTLFSFLEIHNLSDENFDDLYNRYLKQKKSKAIFYYQYLQVDLDYIKQMKDETKNGDIIQNKKLKKDIETLKSSVDQLKSENFELKEENHKLSLDINKLNTEIDELKNRNDELVKQYESIPPLIKAQIERYHQMKSINKKETKMMDLQVIKAILVGFEKKLYKKNCKTNLLYVACEAGISDVVRYILSQNNIDVNAKCIFDDEIYVCLFNEIFFSLF